MNKSHQFTGGLNSGTVTSQNNAAGLQGHNNSQTQQLNPAGLPKNQKEELRTIDNDDPKQSAMSKTQTQPASKSNDRVPLHHGASKQPDKRADSKDGLRASITREVTTSKPVVQPTQGPQSKKFDNCVTKFSFATKTGFSPKNPNKVNQDSYLVLPHLGEYRRTHFFAVCDGHGVFGKEVSEFVKTRLGSYVEQSIKNTFDQAKIAQRVVDSTEVKE